MKLSFWEKSDAAYELKGRVTYAKIKKLCSIFLMTLSQLNLNRPLSLSDQSFLARIHPCLQVPLCFDRGEIFLTANRRGLNRWTRTHARGDLDERKKRFSFFFLSSGVILRGRTLSAEGFIQSGEPERETSLVFYT